MDHHLLCIHNEIITFNPSLDIVVIKLVITMEILRARFCSLKTTLFGSGVEILLARRPKCIIKGSTFYLLYEYGKQGNNTIVIELNSSRLDKAGCAVKC